MYDTVNPKEVYLKSLRTKGETNAHFIVDELKAAGLPQGYQALPAVIGSTLRGAEAFLVPQPDLVIVHRSAFGDTPAGEQALSGLIRSTEPPTQILVFSRKPDTNNVEYREGLENDGDARGRVTAVVMPKAGWADSLATDNFIREVKKLLR